VGSRASRKGSASEPGGPTATPDEVLRALADPGRLAVAGVLSRGPRTTAEIQEETGLKADAVRRNLARLTRVGIVAVEADRRTYRLRTDALRRAATDAGPTREPGLALGAVDDEEESVLRQYFRAGRLTEIPVRRAKRLIVLERLALEFEVGTRYPEREVNRILERFHPDYASLRRSLVDDGFLSRERGEYWRIGGRLDI
jgi:DNA-binding HxlR family transcriptional regulator